MRDDGITYHQYVTELTYLLFLGMEAETAALKGADRSAKALRLPKGYPWQDLEAREGVEQLEFYRELLAHLGNVAKGPAQSIFGNANTNIKHPKHLEKLVDSIDALEERRRESIVDLLRLAHEEHGTARPEAVGTL